MSAPDDKPEGLTSTSGALAEMKRYQLAGQSDAVMDPDTCELVAAPYVYHPADADRVIAAIKEELRSRDYLVVVLRDDIARLTRERDEADEAIAARDARIAQLEEREMSSADLRQRITTLTERLASRDAEIAEAREIMLRAGSWFQIQEVAHPRLSHKARAIWLSMQRWLTPSNVPAEPSGGEK